MQNNSLERTARQKRVQFLKKLIIRTIFILILTPTILCMVLFWRIHKVERELNQLSGQLTEMIGLLEEKIEHLKESDESSQNTQELANSSLLAAEDSNIAVEELPSMEDRHFMEEKDSEHSGEQKDFAEVMKIYHPEEVLSGSDTEEVHSGDIPLEEVSSQEETFRKVYLTFDDGPSIYTDDILDILDRYEVKATFFVLGKEDEYSQKMLKEIVDRGHTLGMHSYSHIYNEIYRSLDDFAEDFHKIQDYLYEVTGVKSTVYRFPGGSSNAISNKNTREFAEYLRSQNVEYYDWNISSGDGRGGQLSVHAIISNSTADITSFQESIILMHDASNKRTTVEALPIIIENILALENTVILPITDETMPIQHIHIN